MIDFEKKLKIVQYSLGKNFACALFNDQKIRCWGQNHKGQLGVGSTTSLGSSINDLSSLKAIDFGVNPDTGGLPPLYVASGANHSCAILDDISSTVKEGKVKCWGESDRGQLGSNSNSNIGDKSFDEIKLASIIPLGEFGSNNGIKLLK